MKGRMNWMDGLLGMSVLWTGAFPLLSLGGMVGGVGGK